MPLAEQQWCPTSVQVTVQQARGLRIKGKSGTNDAYAVMQVGKEKFQTSVVEKSVAPAWREEAAFDLPPLLHQDGGGGKERGTLRVHVLHRALVGPDKLLGQAVVNLLQLGEDKAREKTEWFKLLDKTGKADKDRGEVLLDIQFMRHNMTASMFDLSASGKSRSRMGKLKDKVRGKKKESDTASDLVPSFPQVLTESDEEGTGDAELAAGKADKKKKHKMKSLFSHKSNLQKNMSQSMTVLTAKNFSLSGSQSSGLNVDSSEGKKKFKFLIHKRSNSSDGKDAPSGQQKHGAAEPSNVCINGSHVYCEEPPPRASRIGSSFSLASSGHGSMEDVPESSPPSVDSRRGVRQYSPWTEEEEELENTKEDAGQQRREEEEKLRMEREIITGEEERVGRKEELERLADETRRQEEEERRTEEENVKRVEEERIRREEAERRQQQEEEERVKREQDKCDRLTEQKLRLQEQERLIGEERVRKEEEERIHEERRKKEEREEKRRFEEEERIRMEEESAQEERRRQDERVREQEEERKLAEQKRLEEEERRKEEEMVRRQEEEREEKRRFEEQERSRKEEEERIRMEEESAQEERKRQEEEARVRGQEEECKLAEQKRLEEEEERRIEEDKLSEEERIRREEEMAEEERKRREEEEMMKRREEEEMMMKRREEEEKMMKRREEEEMMMMMKRREEEEKMMKRREEEEKMMKRREEEEMMKRREEEEMMKRREEEEMMKRQEEEEMMKRREKLEEKRRLEEQERRRRKHEERIKKEKEQMAMREKEEYERLVEEKRKLEEEDRMKAEEEQKARREKEEHEKLVENKRKLEEEERKRIKAEEQIRREEVERMRVEEEKIRVEEERRKEEERVRRQEEEERKQLAEETRILEEHESRIEKERKQREEMRRREEEENSRKEKEENERLVVEKERRIEEEENIKREEEQSVGRKEKAEGARKEEEARKKEKLTREAVEQKKENKTKHKAAGKKSGQKVAVEGPAEVTSTNPFDENISNNPFEEIPDSHAGPGSSTAKMSAVQQRVQSAASSVGSKPISSDEKDPINTQRERRPAPQPPGRNPAERRSQREPDGATQQLAQINKKSKDKDIKTISVLPQRSVQTIAPMSRSSTEKKNTQSLTQNCAAKETSNVVKHGKRTAPSTPRSVEEDKTTLSSDDNISHECGLVAKRVSIVYSLNPFEDDDVENAAQEDSTTSGNTGSVKWPLVLPQAADKDTASQAKNKSSKAHAPSLPAKIAATSSTSIHQNTERVHVAGVTVNSVAHHACDPASEAVRPVRVQEDPLQESQPAPAQRAGEDAGGVKVAPPIASRRLQPVKPLNPLEQQSVSVVQGVKDNKSTCDLQVKMKVNDTGLKGPYSQLTQGELISLVLKQEKQLSERDKKISELEKYIDDLIVRVIEEKPSILMSLNSKKKAT